MGASSRGGCVDHYCGGPRRQGVMGVLSLEGTLKGYLFLCRRRDGKRRRQNHRRHRQVDIGSCCHGCYVFHGCLLSFWRRSLSFHWYRRKRTAKAATLWYLCPRGERVVHRRILC